MADHKTLQVADAIIAKTAAVTGIIGTGLLTDKGHSFGDEPAPPAMYTGIAQQNNDDGPTQRVTSTPQIFVHTIVVGDQPTRTFYAMLKELEDAIDNDPMLGGLCLRARVSQVSVLNTSATIAARTFVADIFIDVEYYHDRGDA